MTLNLPSTRARCPVCRERVYSRSGIHPQCAAKRGEAEVPRPPSVTEEEEAPSPAAVGEEPVDS